jgi:transglycosylase-like protein with SLT domain
MAALSSTDLAFLTDFHGANAGVDPDLLHAIALTESSGDPSAISPSGAKGLMQFTSTTAKKVGVLNPFDPNQSIAGAATVLKENLDRFGDPYHAAMAYNAGWDPSKWNPDYGNKVAANYYQLTRRPLSSGQVTAAQPPAGTTPETDPLLQQQAGAPAPAQVIGPESDPLLQQSAPGHGGSITVPQGTAGVQPNLVSAGAPISQPELEKMPWWERAALNVTGGAGNVELAMLQLASKIPGLGSLAPSEADIQQQRQLQAQLAESTTGGRALQVAGEAAPQLAIPYGGLTRTLSAGLRLIPGAGRFLPLTTSGAKLGFGGAVTEGGLQGGLAGALMPVSEDESRPWNVGASAGLGMALPLAANLGGLGASWISRATGIGPGRQGAAGRFLVKTLGGPDAAADVAARIDNPPVNVVPDAPHSTAVITQDPTLAALERGARQKNPAAWSQLDQDVNQARQDYLTKEATPQADQVEALKAQRDTATAPLRTQAINLANAVPNVAAPVTQVADWLTSGPSRANPAVQRVVQYVKQNLPEGADANDLYTVKKVLTSKLTAGGIPDELGAAAKQSQAETMQLINAIDDALHNASTGKWSEYNQRYGELSAPVTDAQAQANIRDALTATGAKITPTRLNSVVLREGSNPWGPTLLPETKQALDLLRQDLEAGDILGRVRGTMTGGGGSQTPGDLAAMALLEHTIPGLGLITKFGREGAGTGVNEAVNRALLDPEVMKETLARTFGQSVVSLRQQMLRNMLRLTPPAAYQYAQPLPALESPPQ